MRAPSARRGSAMIEFALAGIAGVTMLIATVQLSMAMWNYHTLAYATHETNRYISVHGRSCSQGGNHCTITVGNVATLFKTLAVGLPADRATLTLTSDSGVVYTCNPVNTCLSDGTQWPPVAHMDNAPGRFTTVTAGYSFNSAIAVIWPGAGSTAIGTITLPSTSRIIMQF
jgi:Flp pilus assembly protein TadG